MFAQLIEHTKFYTHNSGKIIKIEDVNFAGSYVVNNLS